MTDPAQRDTHRFESVPAVRESLEAEGFVVEGVQGQPWFLRVLSGPRNVADTFGHWAGWFYMQQASTGLAADLLGARPGERVLDLCAAPGGKTLHLAEAMEGRGAVVAAEVNESRIRALLGNLYRLGTRNVMVVAGDGREFPEGATFDRVMVDVPCSALGAARRKGGVVPSRSRGFMHKITRSQEALLRRAIELTRPGGVILYVTCTFGPEENEAVVSRVLADTGATEALARAADAPAVWKKGSPFRGLHAFEFEHATVFFGRTKAVSDILQALRQQARDGRAFVLVLGMSGGGKSSVVRAGVLPMLMQPGVIEGVVLWRRAVFRPADTPGDLFASLAAALLREHALPSLDPDSEGPEPLARVLRESPRSAVQLIKGALDAEAANLARKRGNDAGKVQSRLALVVDQMEEMFTQGEVTAQDRKAFANTLDALARSGRAGRLRRRIGHGATLPRSPRPASARPVDKLHGKSQGCPSGTSQGICRTLQPWATK